MEPYRLGDAVLHVGEVDGAYWLVASDMQAAVGMSSHGYGPIYKNVTEARYATLKVRVDGKATSALCITAAGVRQLAHGERVRNRTRLKEIADWLAGLAKTETPQQQEAAELAWLREENEALLSERDALRDKLAFVRDLARQMISPQTSLSLQGSPKG